MRKALLCIVCSLILSASCGQQPKEFIYVGTYSVRGSEGIYVFEFDRKNGTLQQVQTNSTVKSPSFLDFHPSGRFLYSTSEVDNHGSCASFARDPKTGFLTFINQASSEGTGAAHISIDQTGRLAFVSNYGGGSIAVVPIMKDGSLSKATHVVHHDGSSVIKERQDKSHVHSAYASPDNRFLIVSDLGTDKIYSYEINYDEGKIKPAAEPFVSVVPGGGPRHLVFHPDRKHIYSVEEISSTVGVLIYEKETGAIKMQHDSVRSLPQGFTTFNKSADIHLDPNGKFLYMSNRGLDAISIFSVSEDGMITLVGQQEVMGKTPRNFMIDPRGEFVFVANQDSDNISIFKLDKNTGKMNFTGIQVKVPSPVCLKMIAN